MTISFARHQFPPVIIRHAVWLYVRFTLSYRDVEDLSDPSQLSDDRVSVPRVGVAFPSERTLVM
jgi:transposase-like protein